MSQTDRNTQHVASPASHGSWWGAWSFAGKVVRWGALIIIIFILIRLLSYKWLFNTTSGLLTADLGLTELSALPLAVMLTIAVSSLGGALIPFFLTGRKPFQAAMAAVVLSGGAWGLGTFSENLVPERVYLCRPDQLQFFTRKGAGRIFYARIGERFEFFNRPGVHPQRGIALQAVTPKVAGQMLDVFESGQSPVTARECELERTAEKLRSSGGVAGSGWLAAFKSSPSAAPERPAPNAQPIGKEDAAIAAAARSGGSSINQEPAETREQPADPVPGTVIAAAQPTAAAVSPGREDESARTATTASLPGETLGEFRAELAGVAVDRSSGEIRTAVRYINLTNREIILSNPGSGVCGDAFARDDAGMALRCVRGLGQVAKGQGIKIPSGGSAQVLFVWASASPDLDRLPHAISVRIPHAVSVFDQRTFAGEMGAYRQTVPQLIGLRTVAFNDQPVRLH